MERTNNEILHMRFQKCTQKREKRRKIKYSSMRITNQGENIRTQLLNVLFVKIPYIKTNTIG